MQQHQSILNFSRARYLKLALLLCAGAIAAYAWHEPPTASLKPYGGTWLGYTLGSIRIWVASARRRHSSLVRITSIRL